MIHITVILFAGGLQFSVHLFNYSFCLSSPDLCGLVVTAHRSGCCSQTPLLQEYELVSDKASFADAGNEFIPQLFSDTSSLANAFFVVLQ